MRRLRFAAVALAALGLLASQAAAAEPQTNLADLEDEVMCPVCGTLLELSGAPQADREREFIRERIDEGLSKDEIKDALVDEYGEDVLATPSTDGFDLTAWVVPIVGILIAAIAIGLAIARLRGRSGGDPGPDLEASDTARLDRDMSSYDL